MILKDASLWGMDSRDLENRLIKFGVSIIELSRKFTTDYAAKHISNQMIRSGTAPALIYAEAIDAQSIRDFIHKMKLVLKELRETSVALKVAKETRLCTDKDYLKNTLTENSQLIVIFISSVKTAKRRL